MSISLLGVARGARWNAAAGADPHTKRSIGNDIKSSYLMLYLAGNVGIKFVLPCMAGYHDCCC